MADIREQIAKNIHAKEKLLYGFYASSDIVPAAQFEWEELNEYMQGAYLQQADQILNIKCSRGGVCPECIAGFKQNHQPCPTCKGTGTLPIETKSAGTILKEWEMRTTNKL